MTRILQSGLLLNASDCDKGCQFSGRFSEARFILTLKIKVQNLQMQSSYSPYRSSHGQGGQADRLITNLFRDLSTIESLVSYTFAILCSFDSGPKKVQQMAFARDPNDLKIESDFLPFFATFDCNDPQQRELVVLFHNPIDLHLSDYRLSCEGRTWLDTLSSSQ